MHTLKVYMMIGVPGETEADIDELVAFTRELSRIHRVALGISPLALYRAEGRDTLSRRLSALLLVAAALAFCAPWLQERALALPAPAVSEAARQG